MQDWPELFSHLPIQRFAAMFGDKHNMIFATQAGMRQALIGSGHKVSPCGFSWLIKPHKEKLTPRTLKAFQVSLVEPVAYPLGFTVTFFASLRGPVSLNGSIEPVDCSPSYRQTYNYTLCSPRSEASEARSDIYRMIKMR